MLKKHEKTTKQKVDKMNLQEALDAPSVHSLHFPSSFYPRNSFPGVISIETNINDSIISDLEKKGHIIQKADPWSHGKVMGIKYNNRTKLIHGACSAKGIIGYCIGW